MLRRIEYSPVIKPVHIVTLKGVPDSDDMDQTTLHMGPHNGCGYWEQCMVCEKGEYSPSEEDSEEGEYDRHGEFHQHIDDNWMTFRGCALEGYTDSANEQVQDLFWQRGDGTYLVDVDYWGDGIWDVTYMKTLA